jgi:hypothetical protein
MTEMDTDAYIHSLSEVEVGSYTEMSPSLTDHSMQFGNTMYSTGSLLSETASGLKQPFYTSESLTSSATLLVATSLVTPSVILSLKSYVVSGPALNI